MLDLDADLSGQLRAVMGPPESPKDIVHQGPSETRAYHLWHQQDTWTARQAIGTAICASSILTLVITQLLDGRTKRKRSARRAQKDASPKTILPPQ